MKILEDNLDYYAQENALRDVNQLISNSSSVWAPS